MKITSFSELLTSSALATLVAQVPEAATSGDLINEDTSSLQAQSKAALNKKALDLLGALDGAQKRVFPKQLSKGVIPMLAALLPQRFGGLNRKGFLLNGQMGTGKTGMTFTAAYLYACISGMLNRGFKLVMITDKSALVPQMGAEAIAFLGAEKVEVFNISTKPSSKRGEVSLEQAYTYTRKPGKISLFVMSKDTGKSALKWETASYCEVCCKKMETTNGISSCPWCGNSLKKVVGGKISFSIALDRLANKKRDTFDLFLMDEAHAMQNPDSLQSQNYRAFVKHSKKTILMTGTLTNGYASSMFHILYPVFFKEMKDMGFGYDKMAEFIDFFGSRSFVERRTQRAYSGAIRNERKVSYIEQPRINYRVVPFCLTLGATITIEDLALQMPPFRERQYAITGDHNLLSQVDYFCSQISRAENKLVKKISSSKGLKMQQYILNNLARTYEHRVAGYVENSETHVLEPFDHTFVLPPVLEQNSLSSKEQKLIELVQGEIAEGRRTLLYTLYTDANSVQDRLFQVLSDAGISVGVIDNQVKAGEILDKITDFEGDVLIVSQRRVETGFNLTMFHTVIFYEICDQIRVVQQAKCRPWRPIGQDKDVRVYYMAYHGAQLSQLHLTGVKVVSTTVSSGQRIMSDTIADLYDYQRSQTSAINQAEAAIMEIQAAGESNNGLKALTPLEEAYSAFLDNLKAAKQQVEATVVEQHTLDSGGDSENGEDKAISCEVCDIEVDFSFVEDAPNANGLLFSDEELRVTVIETQTSEEKITIARHATTHRRSYRQLSLF